MTGRLLNIAIALVAMTSLTAVASAADYRGAAAGWPVYANGTYAANYQANAGAGPAYYVARPVAVAGYGGYATQSQGGTMYMPVRAAYANPTYFAAYGRSPVMYRPVSTAGYAPAAGGYYAPVAGYARNATEGVPYSANYAPATVNYAPANSYAVTPAGSSSAGSEAAAYYGQPTTLNYVPPRYAYRPTYAAVPVYAYRPVTTYQPVTGQPVTCMQPATYNTCQPQRTRCSSWWNPFTWFGHGRSSCGASACGPAPTTTYCGTAACGQPYYPVPTVQPVVPVIPSVPANTIPAVPRGFLPSGQPTIPPPPTMQPGTRTIISPAETRPSLAPGVGTTPGTFGAPPSGFSPFPSSTIPGSTIPGSTIPGSTFPGSTIPAQPAPVVPGGSFPTAPTQPPTGFGTGSFGTGANYAPPSDPYSSVMTPAASQRNATEGVPYRASGSTTDDGVIRAPELRPALPPSVQTVPDLDAPAASPTPRPASAAPQLLDPRDKTAGRNPRWAVVPAQWPTKNATARQLTERPTVETKAYEARGLAGSPYVNAQPSAGEYDDRGWKTAGL